MLESHIDNVSVPGASLVRLVHTVEVGSTQMNHTSFSQPKFSVHVAVLVSVCAVLTALASPTASRSAHAQTGPAVLAYYYAWWDPPNFGQSLYQPDQPYNSDDGGMIRQHVSQAQRAGIDGFVMSWYGNGDRTDSNLGQLLDAAQSTGFHATIDVETPHFWGVDDTIAQLQAFYANRIDHPAIVRFDGRPVIFFWRANTYGNATWDSIRAQVDPDRKAIWIADGDQFGILSGNAWDGISPYAIAWSSNPASQLVSWANKARAVAPDKLWIPPVSPGCNDAMVRAPTCVRDRGDGSYYQATWDGALASGPQWAVIVSTFNEWLESTQIEPSVQYGDQYLQLTRANADQFRSARANDSL